MDVVSVVSAITSIVVTAAKVSKILHNLHSSYRDATPTVQFLMHECYAINGALSQLQGWLCSEDPAVRSKQRLIQLDLLINTISAAMCSFTKLQFEVDKLDAPKSNNWLIPLPFKFMWKESNMQAILGQLQSHKTSLTLILTILSRLARPPILERPFTNFCSQSDSQTQKTLDEIAALVAIMSKDQQRMWHTMKRSNLVSADGRSLLSRPSDSSHPNPEEPSGGDVKLPADFTFDYDLKSSTPYRRQYEADQSANPDGESVLTVDDVSDILDLVLPGDVSGTRTVLTTGGDATIELESPGLARVKIRDQDALGYRSPQCKSVFSWLATEGDALSDWAQFWELLSEDIEAKPGVEINRQKVIHKVIQEEREYHRNLGIFIMVYRSHLRFLDEPGETKGSDPDIVALKKALRSTFDSFDRLRTLHEELLVPLISRAVEEGPWIRGLSDIYHGWLPKARVSYLDFAAVYYDVDIHMRRAKRYCSTAEQYLKLCLRDQRARGLSWQTLIESPIVRVREVDFLIHTLPPNATDKDKLHSRLLIGELWRDMEKKLGDQVRDQPVKHFKERLGIDKHLASTSKDICSEVLDKVSKMHFKGDLIHVYGQRDLAERVSTSHIVIVGDYLLFTHQTHEGMEAPPGPTSLEYESYRTKYILERAVGVVLLKISSYWFSHNIQLQPILLPSKFIVVKFDAQPEVEKGLVTRGRLSHILLHPTRTLYCFGLSQLSYGTIEDILFVASSAEERDNWAANTNVVTQGKVTRLTQSQIEMDMGRKLPAFRENLRKSSEIFPSAFLE